jgi:hypothetical protein
MDWRLKVIKQSLLIRIPFGQTLRRVKRKYFGYEPNPNNLQDTLSYFFHMEEVLRGMNRSFEGATVLEIGSGWFPTIPIMLGVGGAKRILMSDLNPHMDAVTFASTLRFLKRAMPSNRCLQGVNNIDDLPISYLAPFDTDVIPDGSIDCVISRTVLEHIPSHDIYQLLTALRSKLSPSGLMMHLVDHSDHFEHSDKSISKINFLTWSGRKHAVINFLTREGENRMRHHEYPPLFEMAGYRVTSTFQVHESTRVQARSLHLAPPYASMSADQLATLSSVYVLTPHQIADGSAVR